MSVPHDTGCRVDLAQGHALDRTERHEEVAERARIAGAEADDGAAALARLGRPGRERQVTVRCRR